VKLNSEFFTERCAPATFRLAKKFGEIDPRWPDSIQQTDLTKNPSQKKQNFVDRRKKV
jgi:hypothetical protein